MMALLNTQTDLSVRDAAGAGHIRFIKAVKQHEQ